MKTLFRLHYELPADRKYTEAGADSGAKFYPENIEDPDVRESLMQVWDKELSEMLVWLNKQPENPKIQILPLSTRTPEALAYRLDGKKPSLVYVTRPLHTIKMLDEFLHELSVTLDNGAIVYYHSMTSRLKREMLEKRYHCVFCKVGVAANYFWHRMCPKLKLTRGLYFSSTGGKNRTFHRVEILGRLYRAGFEVLDEQFRKGEFFVTARKINPPIEDVAPTGSPIIHLKRIGKNGKPIVVHKFRTMYTYSEYIQSYMYQYQNLQVGGKFKDDYRVNFWGKFLRKVWLDELPMVWNLIRGDIKLVGVRPLSKQYFNLYTPEMQQLRTRTKPGLLPPFYYDNHTPETIEEVQASERRYLEAYLQHPLRTDWRYFWGILTNIVFRHKRSK